MSKFTSSMMCISAFELESKFPIIEKNTDMYHIDIMDANYVPNITLPFTYVKELRKSTNKPIDAHLMINHPLEYLDDLIEYGADYITIHPDTVPISIFKCIKKMKENNVKVGIALNPSVDLYVIKPYIDQVDKITIMTVEPGFAGQKMIPSTLKKIREAKELRDKLGLSYLIEIDGNNNYETFPKYQKNGADIYVLGSTVFNASDLQAAFVKLKEFFKIQNNGYRIGVDVGGTFTRVGLVDENLQVSDVEKLSTKDTYEELIDTIHCYVKKHNDKNITGIGIGIPGIVDSKNGDIISVPARNKLQTKGFTKMMEAAVGIPVKIDKDVNCLLRNDIHVLGLDEIKNVIGFYVGTGFGNAMKLDGHLYYGDNSFAGELGHIPVLESDVKCGCGNKGCLETIVSGNHLRQIHNKYFAGVEIDDLFSEYKKGNELDKFIEDLAKGIAMELNIIDVSHIFLGGGVVHMKNFPKAELEGYIKEHLRCDYTREKLSVAYVDSKTEDGIIGSAIMFDL